MPDRHLADVPNDPATDRRSAHQGDREVVHIGPYLALVRDIAALIVPMRPHPEFQARLEGSLLEAARQQRAQAALEIAPRSFDGVASIASERHGKMVERLAEMRSDSRRQLMISAAVGSAVSLAGIVALVWRYRSSRKAA